MGLNLNNSFGSTTRKSSVRKSEKQISPEEFNQKFCRKNIKVPLNSKRDHIANEILETEKTYIWNLQVAIELHEKTLLAAANDSEITLDEEEVKLLFGNGNIQDIVNVNTILLDNLENRFDKWTDKQLIGDVFLTLTPFLKLYTNYTSLYDTAVELISRKRKKDKELSKLLDNLQEHPLAQKLDINSFLILPVQRIPRYVMLLTDFLNNTDKSHPDYNDLSDSLSLMKKVADEINKSMNENENKRKCIELSKIFTETVELVEVHRLFVYEGQLKKQCRKLRKPRKFWLFNDILLYGKPASSSKYKLSGILELTDLSMKDIPDDADKDIFNAFEFSSKSKSFMVFAETPQEKTKWVDHIRGETENVTNRRNTFRHSILTDSLLDSQETAPVWVPDTSIEDCPLCKSKFTILYRKHHCRKCGQVVCDNCSKGKMVVQHLSHDKVRVCNNCFKEEN